MCCILWLEQVARSQACVWGLISALASTWTMHCPSQPRSLNTLAHDKRAGKCCCDSFLGTAACWWSREERRGEQGRCFLCPQGNSNYTCPPRTEHMMDRWKRNWLSEVATVPGVVPLWTRLKHAVITQTITGIHLLAGHSGGCSSLFCIGAMWDCGGIKEKEHHWFRKWINITGPLSLYIIEAHLCDGLYPWITYCR